MSNIAIKGATTGTGTFTIESPATNTDRTLTLPDEAGTVLTSAGAGTDYLTPTGDGSSLTGIVSGVTEVDIWVLTQDTGTVSADAQLNANIARLTANGAGKLGTGMSWSSGVFTFPSTGIWSIQAHMKNQQSGTGGTSNEYAYLDLRTTTDGSTYNSAASAQNSSLDGNDWSSCSVTFIFDVQNVSTHKVTFHVGSQDGVIVQGNPNVLETGFVFTRLGDT